MKAIGPSFKSELNVKELATGLLLRGVQGISWVEGSTERNLDPFVASVTQAQRAAVEEVYAAHNPATPGPIAVNWGGFAKAFVPIIGGATQLRAAMKLYPSLILYFMNHDASGIQADVVAAKAAAHITAQQASDIVAAATANGITLVLP